jgi:hypothetical protein
MLLESTVTLQLGKANILKIGADSILFFDFNMFDVL